MEHRSLPLEELVYEEKVSSIKTMRLFLALTALFSLLFIWRLKAIGSEVLTIIFFSFFVFFLFNSINYRILSIRLFADSLKLDFGIFTRTILLENIADCKLDKLPLGVRIGGAGIHFMFVRGRYRISFNFLEHPRVVILLKHKSGLVQDVSFSTRQPEVIIYLIRNALLKSQ